MSDRIAEIMARRAPEGVRPDVQHFLNQHEALEEMRPALAEQLDELSKVIESEVGGLEKGFHPLWKARETYVEILASIDRMTSQPIPLWMQPPAGRA